MLAPSSPSMALALIEALEHVLAAAKQRFHPVAVGDDGLLKEARTPHLGEGCEEVIDGDW
jgi:hypothetical protein